MNKMNEHMKIMNHEWVCRQQSLLLSRFQKYVYGIYMEQKYEQF